jgi:hypothetical protein
LARLTTTIKELREIVIVYILYLFTLLQLSTPDGVSSGLLEIN